MFQLLYTPYTNGEGKVVDKERGTVSERELLRDISKGLAKILPRAPGPLQLPSH